MFVPGSPQRVPTIFQGHRESNIPWKSYSEAKNEYQKLIKQFGIKNKKQWQEFTKTHELPENLPATPWNVYTKEKVEERKRKYEKKKV